MFDQINRKWGSFIASHPKCHICASFITIAILSFPLINLKIEHDIRASFSPSNSKANYEHEVYKEFFNLTTSPQRSFILFKAKDSGSMLRPNQINDVLILDQRFRAVLKTKDSKSGVSACDPLCNLNVPFHLISEELIKMYKNEQLLKNYINVSNSLEIVNKSEPIDDSFILDYPMSIYRGNKLFTGMNLIDAQVSKDVFPQNKSRIISVKRIILWYFSRADSLEVKNILRKTSLELFEKAKDGDLLEFVNFEIFGDEIANREMVRGAIEATILMSIGFLLLFIFVTIVIYRKMEQISKYSIPVIVLASVLCPFMASFMAFGILSGLGFASYTIMCVTPFLIAGVGVDDAFIMLQSWNQHRHIGCMKQRLCLVMIHVGPSITITSLTNTVAFGIGYATPTPQMSLFCLCTSIAVFFDYLLTFTLLAPIIIYVTPRKNSSTPALELYQEDVNFLEEKVFPEQMPIKNKSDGEISELILKYASFLNGKFGRILALVLLIIIYIIATLGLFRMRSTFEPSKAFPSDSPLATSLEGIRSVFNEFFPISVFVNRPPNISNPNDYRLFYQMVTSLEDLPESYGANRTILWLRAYEAFDRQTSKLWELIGLPSPNYTLDYRNLDFFLRHLNYPPTIKTELDKNGNRHLKAFQFTIIGKGMAEWANRALTEQKCREILQKFPEFNATIHDGDSAVLNLLLTVKIDLIGSITVTVVCMTIICSFFIPSQIGVAIIAFMISSICYTLVGFLSWWGADLDPVTIVDVLLATGFSVDYTAHIAHQFYTNSSDSSAERRLAKSLNEMCSPMIQAGTSTCLCMLPLVFVRTYAIVAFAKTIFIVVGMGILHGLFFMPVLFLCFTSDNQKQQNCLLRWCGDDEKSLAKNAKIYEPQTIKLDTALTGKEDN